jgi:hypothetical protein
MNFVAAVKNNRLRFGNKNERRISPNEEEFRGTMDRSEWEAWPLVPIATMTLAQLRARYVFLPTSKKDARLERGADPPLCSSIPSSLKW